MKRRRQSMGRRKASKSTGKRKTVKRKSATNLRQTLYGVGLWALGIMNALLIASFIHKNISSNQEEMLSFPTKGSQSSRQETVITAPLTLEILNGCGVQGIAKKFADYLEAAGYKPINVGNYENFDLRNTLILDHKAQNRHNGLKVAEILGVSSTYVQHLANDNTRADVTIIIGKDYTRLNFFRSKK